MIAVTPREALVLSYLTGLGIPGEWVPATRSEIQTGIGSKGHMSSVSQVLRSLREKGFIECFGERPNAFRVLRRLEDPEVVQVELRPQHAAPRRAKTPQWPGKGKRLIRYAGWDGTA